MGEVDDTVGKIGMAAVMLPLTILAALIAFFPLGILIGLLWWADRKGKNA